MIESEGEEERSEMGMKPVFKIGLAELSRGLTPTDSVDWIPVVDRIGQLFEKS